MSEDLTEKLPRSDSDTRPIWEKLVADIAQLKESLHQETHEIKRSLRDLYRGQTVLNDSILKVHVDLLDIDERLQVLEGTHNQQNSST